jgi:hypothetical protein
MSWHRCRLLNYDFGKRVLENILYSILVLGLEPIAAYPHVSGCEMRW